METWFPATTPVTVMGLCALGGAPKSTFNAYLAAIAAEEPEVRKYVHTSFLKAAYWNADNTHMLAAGYKQAGKMAFAARRAVDQKFYIDPLTNAVIAQGLMDLSAATAGRIKFPASQVPSADPNTLDGYAEGSAFTPTLTFGGSSTGITYSKQACQSTVIGNVATVAIEIILTSKGSSTGPMEISLPYSVNSIGVAAAVRWQTWPHQPPPIFKRCSDQMPRRQT